MAREVTSLYSLNRGIVSRLGLARVDIKRLALAAETMQNWMAHVLGYMTLRPGWKYIGATQGAANAKFVRFIFATDDVALLELTDSTMRIWMSDVLLSRPSVATTIANGDFTTNLTSWTDLDDAGATSSQVAPGYMQLVGDGTARAIREQQVTVAAAAQGVEHGIRVVIARGPVSCRIGSTSGDDNYLKETTLNTGTHSLSIVPTGDFFIRFFSTLLRAVWVDSCNIEASGVVTLPTPWTAEKLASVRYDQSGDVVFVACVGLQQRRIERRGTRPAARSWSVALYQPTDGPFQIQNVSPTTLTPSAINGNITLTASVPLFKATHVGALFSVTSIGQIVSTTSAVSGTATASIRVSGTTVSRAFTIVISGNASASTVDLQRSFDNATWVNVGGIYSWTTNVTTSLTDGLDGQITYYRLNLSNRIAPDSVTMTLQFPGGSIRGVVRITAFTSSTSVSAEVLSALGGTTANSVWQEGKWSDLRGWPTAVRIHEGRMWWAGLDGIWGSISDAFDAFDETRLGDSGPINRTIGAGPVDTINWILSLQGLVLGAQGAEFTVRASSLDEPLTPTSFNMRSPSTQGSGNVEAVKIDQSAVFVDRSGCKLFDLGFDVKAYNYAAASLMETVPELGRPGIVRMDVQRKPDTRIHCVRSDGTVAVAVINRAEDVLAWTTVTTNGTVEDVAVLPARNGDLDDQVYYLVRRVINGAVQRFIEKWAQELECRGDQQLCMLADSYVTYSGSATTVVPVAHLEGQQVVVWADGHDAGTIDTARPWTQRYTVSGGQITLQQAASNVVVGLGYEAPFLSAKLGSAANGTPLHSGQKVERIGLMLANVHPKGVRFGPSLDVLDDMPGMENGVEKTNSDAQTVAYDEDMIEFPGTWTTDARVCLLGVAPRPATVLAVTLDMQTHR